MNMDESEELSPRQKLRLRYKMKDPERFKRQKKADDAKYRASHKEEKSQKDREYRLKNAEALKLKKAAYYAKNKEAISARVSRGYREVEGRRDRILAYSKAYREANGESVRATIKAWVKSHPDRVREVRAKNEAIRRERKRQVESVAYDPIDIYERDLGICYLCTMRIDIEVLWPDPFSFTIDHIIPFSKYGDDVPSNVASAHLTCNQQKASAVVDTPDILRST